jgi:putative transcriptional regulator
MDNDVRERREAADMSQADLAEAVGVTRQTINSIERGRYDPSLELAFRLARFFEVRVEDLFDPALDG